MVEIRLQNYINRYNNSVTITINMWQNQQYDVTICKILTLKQPLYWIFL